MTSRTVDVSDSTGAVDGGWLLQLEAVAEWVLAEEGVGRAEVSVTLLSDEAIAELNQRYLSHGGPTDVISFPLDDLPGCVVGDIYIGAEQARREAGEAGVPEREELMRLVVHGLLHVLGWDHPDDAEARAGSPMYRRQEELLAGFLRQRPN